MKKTISIILIIILTLFLNSVIYAANESFSIKLESTKTEVKPTEEIEVKLKIKDFQNINEGIYAFSGTIVYDTNVFEPLTDAKIKGEGSWSAVPTSNPITGQITADSGGGVKTESDVITITLKVKENAAEGTIGKITIKDFEASEGEVDILANEDATMSVKIVKDITDDNPGDNDNNPGDNDNNPNDNNNNNGNNNSGNNNSGNNNSGNNNTGNSNNGTGNKGNNSNGNLNSNGSKDDKLPQTGEAEWIVFPIAIVITIIGIISYKKYKKAY